jgi:tRNA(Ile)-lysidine synthase
LFYQKKEIIDYLKHYNLKYRTDLTNQTDDAERNFLRNQIIPKIEKRLNPSLSNSLFKSSEVFRNIYTVVKKKAAESEDKLISDKENYLSLSLKEFNKIEEGYRGEVLRYIFSKMMAVHLTFDDCSRIFSLLKKQTGKSVNLPDNIKVLRERTELIIQKGKIKETFKAVTLNAGDTIKINDRNFSINEVGTIKKKFGSNKNLEYISGDNTTNNFLIRRWTPGDRFYPFGMAGKKKISDFLNEQKISSFKKKEQMVLLNQHRIIWVIGLRLDERFRVTPETKKIYQLCLS